MATNVDAYASRGVKNVFGQVGLERCRWSNRLVVLWKCSRKLVLLVLFTVLWLEEVSVRHLPALKDCC